MKRGPYKAATQDAWDKAAKPEKMAEPGENMTDVKPAEEPQERRPKTKAADKSADKSADKPPEKPAAGEFDWLDKLPEK